MGWSQDLFRALWRSLSREVKEHVGTDQFGNKYYYIPQYKNWRGEVAAWAAIAWAVIARVTSLDSSDRIIPSPSEFPLTP
uniref:NADH:ubiquinone oxidoreductase complex assembly factor 2 n=2 Tax=Pan TaxID=9596 RepID=A0A2I3SUJ3_PANTR